MLARDCALIGNIYLVEVDVHALKLKIRGTIVASTSSVGINNECS